MIQLISICCFIIVAVITNIYWQQAEGFHATDPTHWKWLVSYVRDYNQFPTWFLVSIASGFATTFAMVMIAQLVAARVKTRKVHGEYDTSEVHGSAHFASKAELKKTDLWKKTGVVVGGWKTPTGVRHLKDDGPDQILMVGGPRSGKGVGPVLSTLLSWTASVVVNDIRGENFGKSSGWQEKRGAKVLKFSPASLEGSCRWNPLAEIRIDTDYEISDAQSIAMMVIDPDGTGLKDFWMKSGFAWLAASILHVMHKVRSEENRVATLGDVSLYLSTPDGDFEQMLELMQKFNHGTETINQFVSASASEMLAAAHPERSGVHSSAKTELMLYRDPIIARNIATNDFYIDEIQNGEKPVALYIIIPPNDLDRLRPILRVFWNLLLRRLMQEYGYGGNATYKRQLLIMFDEFTSVKKLDIFEQALAYMGGYGIKSFLVVQDIMQIERIYGRENSILGLCKIKLFYSANETRTAKIMSDLCGVTTVITQKSEKSRKALQIVGGNMTDRLAEVQRPLLTTDECTRLKPAKKTKDGKKIIKPGEMLIIATGHAPILGIQPLYFKNSEMKSRAVIPPVGNFSSDGRREVESLLSSDVETIAMDAGTETSINNSAAAIRTMANQSLKLEE